MYKFIVLSMSLLGVIISQNLFAFCGFYVAKADAKLFNQASQVVLAHQDDKTVITMANDFKGEFKEFAVVIPVPTFIKKEQIHITEKAIIDHLDAYTAPRLVEYFDENPCNRLRYESRKADIAFSAAPSVAKRERAYGVKVEAEYTVGEYDIVILSAEQSDGLEMWLKDNGYRIPDGANRVLGSYIKQDMKFFVAKVNLTEQIQLGFNYLRPIQVAYESPKFMLPIRLGTVNSQGTQELFVYTLTQRGRVETTNYRTVKLPSDVELPIFIKNEFADFYRTLFEQQVKQQGMRTVFLEYAWDMNWCDPCAADPLSSKELKELGVFWQTVDNDRSFGQAQNVFVTRLHVRYDAEHFPEDLILQETGDNSNFQGRYILRHPWTGSDSCEEVKTYRQQLQTRQEKEAQTLANLTGWEIGTIRSKIDTLPTHIAPVEEKPWWQYMWD